MDLPFPKYRYTAAKNNIQSSWFVRRLLNTLPCRTRNIDTRLRGKAVDKEKKTYRNNN